MLSDYPASQEKNMDKLSPDVVTVEKPRRSWLGAI
jgi:hypothetical protein